MTRRTIQYQPALDGVRALAVTAVLLFHGGVSWMTGGYLGVSVFFTLSGFLITSLLVREHDSTGRIDAKAFYTRRAKRLLPASLICLLGISLMAWLGWFRGVAHLRRDVLGALFQVYNWVQLASGETYSDITQAAAGFKNPTDHYWSLAIEEQFYWVWPLAFAGLVLLARRRGRSVLGPVAVLTGLAAIAAPVIAQTFGPDAAYWSTLARVSEILFGALVACWIAGRELSPRFRHLALPALLVLTVLCMVLPAGSGPAYEGFLPLVAMVSASLILGLQVEGPGRRWLAAAPLVALGRISYGVYLFHWPIFVLIDRQGWDVPVGVSLTVKCAITLLVALLSYHLVEQRVRTSTWFVPGRVLAGALAGTAVVAASVFLVPVTTKYYGVDQVAADAASIDTGSVAPLVPVTTVPDPVAPDSTPDSVAATTTTGPLIPPRPVRIVMVGDSTAEAMGAGLVQWAAANPDLAQVEVVAGAGCGVAENGIRVNGDTEVTIREYCSLYLDEIVPERLDELQPDLVVILTTTWDVADRRLEPGGPVLGTTDPAVQASLAAEFQAYTDMILSKGVSRVVWLREPVPIPGILGPADRQGDPARHAVLYELMDQLAAANPAVRVVDLAGWVTENGLDADFAARPDAVHWTPDAATRISTEFLGPALVREALT